MDYWLDAKTALAERGETVTTRRLFEASRFSQRLLEIAPGRSEPQSSGDADEVLYVLEGEGRLEVGEGEHPIAPGTAVYVPHGVGWSVKTDNAATILSVLVHDPEPAGKAAPSVVDLNETRPLSATAGRQFALGVTPAVGCSSVTQFVGFIPVGRAPDHFHPYDEVVYVLQGEGVLHVGGETAPLRAGACVHLPARLVHCLENTGPGEMQVLGVFRPAGSPAEAYYPDGTPATY